MAVGDECALVSAPGFKPGGGRYGRPRWLDPHTSPPFFCFSPVYREDEQGRRKDEKERRIQAEGVFLPAHPLGRSSIVGPYPWALRNGVPNTYRTDPALGCPYLPYPLNWEKNSTPPTLLSAGGGPCGKKTATCPLA